MTSRAYVVIGIANATPQLDDISIVREGGLRFEKAAEARRRVDEGREIGGRSATRHCEE